MSETQNKESFRFELATPAKAVAEGDYGFVIVPGAEGDFGVLAGHSALISELRPGVIRARKERAVDSGGAEERWFVAGGFAEVAPSRLTLLVSAAEPLDSLDSAEIQQAIQDAQEDLAELQGEDKERERHALEKAIATNHARLKALQIFGTGE